VTAGEREVLIDPDERAIRHRRSVQERVHDKVELVVLAADGVGELVSALRIGLPVDAHGGAATGVLGERLKALGQQRDRRAGVGVEVDDEEVADVMPGRRRDETTAAARGARGREALECHRRPR
jgi:hypothetical protein